jgi:hypothetical protein
MNIPNSLPIMYSLKNIPNVSKFHYQKMLTAKTELLLGRMRWKLFWSQQNNQQKKDFQSFGFKTPHYPPFMKELMPFENDMVEMIKSVEMRNTSNPLQDQMREDIKKIKQIPEIIVEADKTSNLYLIKPEPYSKYLKDTISKEYKKTDISTVDKINVEAAKNARRFGLDDRIEAVAKKPAYLTIKDHKEDFPARLKFRLINPCKSNMGKISKSILDRVNKEVKAATGLKQWKSTGEVLDWYRSLQGKQRMKFLKFDITEYYPSISMDLLKKAINYARQYTTITHEEEETIMHCRKTVLIGNDNSIWMKKNNPDFDTPMGSLDSAEVSETVGLYLLWRLEDIIPDGMVGLYRDDGLSVIEGNGQEVDRVRKKLTKLFKEEGLKITTEGNITVVDYLDVVLDLKNNSYKPFTKVNANTKYVSLQSNHPPVVLANIPDAVSKRLSSVSSSKEMFEAEVRHYQQALSEAGYKDDLVYVEPLEDMEVNGMRKQRSRAVMWYNPPFSSNVKTNVGRKFITLLKKHFPPSSELYKLFNTKKVKLSYSCCPNMKAIISSHNAKITRAKQTVDTPGCNCRGGVEKCPLNGRCLTESLVYKAKVSSCEGDKSYIGQAASTFKLRFNNHTNSFVNPKKKKSTALSSYIWYLNSRGVEYNISWSTECTPQPYQGGSRTCDLCLMEKTLIARSDRMTSLNRRNEVMTKCRHRMPFFLDNYLGLAATTITEDEGEGPSIPPHHDLQPAQINPDPPDLPPLPPLPPIIPEDEGDWLNLSQNNPYPPDPIPEVHPDSQPSVSGPMTRSRRKKQQSNVNI